MAAPSDSTLLIANEELDESEGHSANEGVDHRSRVGVLTDRLNPVLKLLQIWWKTLVIVLTPLALLLLLIFVDTRSARAAYVILIITVYWITEACSITVTALLPLVLFPCLGVITAKETAASYMSDTNMLFVGGLIMAVAFEKQQLHKRIALLVLMLVGSKPHWLLFGFMVTTAFLSMWISNTATAAMMLPIAHAVLQEMKSREKLQQSYHREQDQERTPLRDHDSDESLQDITEMNNNGQPSSSTTVEMMPQGDSDEDNTICDSDTGEDTLDTNLVTTSQDDSYNTFKGEVTERRRKRVRFQLPSQLYSEEKLKDNNSLQKLSKGLMLGVAYGANIGGTATLTGTGPNLVLKGDIAKCFPKSPNVINFGNWFVYGVPQMLLLLLFAWLYLSFMFCRNSILWPIKRLCCKNTTYNLNNNNRVKDVIKKEYKKLGPIRYGEVMVGIFFVILALLWLLREPKFVKGWASVFSADENNQSYVSDTTTVMFIVFLLFILPSRPCIVCKKCSSHNCKKCYHPDMDALHQSGKSDTLLDWPTVQQKLPWNVVILIGSGFALATGAQQSGLSQWIGSKLHSLRHLSTGGIAFLITIIITLVTEVMSNVATTTLFLPILAELAITLEANPLYFMIPATISASFAFMLPVATPPNTMAFSYQYLRVTDMVLTGFVMNVAAVSIVALCLNTYGIHVFDLQSSLPQWANSTSCAT